MGHYPTSRTLTLAKSQFSDRAAFLKRSLKSGTPFQFVDIFLSLSHEGVHAVQTYSIQYFSTFTQQSKLFGRLLLVIRKLFGGNAGHAERRTKGERARKRR